MTPSDEKEPASAPPARKPYCRPEIKKVDLALEETLSSGCKLENECTNLAPDPDLIGAGS